MTTQQDKKDTEVLNELEDLLLDVKKANLNFEEKTTKKLRGIRTDITQMNEGLDEVEEGLSQVEEAFSDEQVS